MSEHGAYEDEMAPLRELHDRDLDRLLAGRRPIHGQADDLAELVRDVRAEHLRPMADHVEARHVSAMAQAARDLSSTQQPAAAGAPARPRRAPKSLLPKNRFAAVAAAIAAMTVTAGMGTAGLAVAGVDVPDAASEVFAQVGVTLPNQDEPSEALRRSREARAAAVRAAIAATPPSEREGCAFGQRVAEAARGEALPAEATAACAAQEARRAEREQERRQDTTPPAGTDVDAAREDRDGFGGEQSERARRQRTASPQERRNFGRDTAERARQRDRGSNAGGNGGGTPPASRPERGGGNAPSSQGRPDGDGPAPGERGGPPEGVGRPEGSGEPEGAGPPPSEGRGRPEGAGRP